jgi:hypothetical protein
MATQQHPQRVPIGEFQTPSGGTVPVRGSKEFLRLIVDLQALVDSLVTAVDAIEESTTDATLAAQIAALQAQVDEAAAVVPVSDDSEEPFASPVQRVAALERRVSDLDQSPMAWRT